MNSEDDEGNTASILPSRFDLASVSVSTTATLRAPMMASVQGSFSG